MMVTSNVGCDLKFNQAEDCGNRGVSRFVDLVVELTIARWSSVL